MQDPHRRCHIGSTDVQLQPSAQLQSWKQIFSEEQREESTERKH